jgi:hypothetical protein
MAEVRQQTTGKAGAACSLCGGTGRITREHIWPKGFLGRADFGVRHSSRARRTFAGELTVRDVCETCNNGPLSTLDAYACTLFDRYFGRKTDRGDVVAFDYDYQLLTRWLLKTAFNTARAAGNEDASLLAGYAPAILAKTPCSPAYVSFRLALVSPSTMMNSATRATKVIYPQAARSGPVVIPGAQGQRLVSLRLLMINSFFFTMAVHRDPRTDRKLIEPLLRRLPGEPLLPSGSMLLVPSMDAAQALAGVERWPRSPARR